MKRKRLARMLDRSGEQMAGLAVPDRGWLHAMRHALGMSAEQLAKRNGVSRNAIYQAERSELEGAVSIRQMERLAHAMGGKFVYAIVPVGTVGGVREQQALARATVLSKSEPEFETWSVHQKKDWIEDTAAQQLHEDPVDFWTPPASKTD